MSGSRATNDQAVQFEQQQAADAAAKEAQRQQRLQQGQTLIDNIFSGQPVTKASPFDWSTFKAPSDPLATYAAATNQPAGTYASGVPTGYTAVKTGQGWGLQDASGKTYAPGSKFDIQTPTGQRTGGFDDAFYNKYKQQILDYKQPEEAKQYSEAQRDLRYNLARAGTLNSSYAGDAAGNLAYNDALAKAGIVADANQQTGQLQNQIQGNKQALIDQLYSTEDPTLTANLAQSSAAASRLQTPTLTPSASLFTPAMTAAGSAVTGLLNPASPYGAQPYANQQGTVAPANANRGKVYQGQ